MRALIPGADSAESRLRRRRTGLAGYEPLHRSLRQEWGFGNNAGDSSVHATRATN